MTLEVQVQRVRCTPEESQAFHEWKAAKKAAERQKTQVHREFMLSQMSWSWDCMHEDVTQVAIECDGCSERLVLVGWDVESDAGMTRLEQELDKAQEAHDCPWMKTD